VRRTQEELIEFAGAFALAYEVRVRFEADLERIESAAAHHALAAQLLERHWRDGVKIYRELSRPLKQIRQSATADTRTGLNT
jgi:hypothetical protein